MHQDGSIGLPGGTAGRFVRLHTCERLLDLFRKPHIVLVGQHDIVGTNACPVRRSLLRCRRCIIYVALHRICIDRRGLCAARHIVGPLHEKLQEVPLCAAGRRILPEDRDAPRIRCCHRLDDAKRLIRGAVIRHHHMQVLHRLIEDRLKLRADVRRTVICT